MSNTLLNTPSAMAITNSIEQMRHEGLGEGGKTALSGWVGGEHAEAGGHQGPSAVG